MTEAAIEKENKEIEWETCKIQLLELVLPIRQYAGCKMEGVGFK